MSMGGHQRTEGDTDIWITPPAILAALQPFDLDPCAADPRPWDTAAQHFTEREDGLSQEWSGRVWLNPPYGLMTGRWLYRLARHGDGVALIFARTETKMFFDWVWERADAALFIRGRLRFYRPDGTLAERTKANAGAPSVLVAYGQQNAQVLRTCGMRGHYVPLQPVATPLPAADLFSYGETDERMEG